MNTASARFKKVGSPFLSCRLSLLPTVLAAGQCGTPLILWQIISPDTAFNSRYVVKYRRCSRQVFDACRAAGATGEQDGCERALLKGEEKEYRADPKAITIPSVFKDSGIRGFKQEEKTSEKNY